LEPLRELLHRIGIQVAATERLPAVFASQVSDVHACSFLPEFSQTVILGRERAEGRRKCARD
jgi:hypothetical protein